MSTTLRRGLGYIEDDVTRVVVEESTHHYGHLLGSLVRARPESFSWLDRLDRILDQGMTSSCLGQALATSLYLGAKARGDHGFARPSARWIYDVARMVDGGPLMDIGSRPTSAIDGLQRFGVCAELRYPLDAAHINDPPPLDVVGHAGDAIVSGHYRVPPGPGSADAMRRAIAEGFMPIFGTPVDDAFNDWNSGDVWPGSYGQELGRHAMVLVGYRPGAFLAVNSWGQQWGDSGTVWIDEVWMESYRVTDRIVVTALPLSPT